MNQVCKKHCYDWRMKMEFKQHTVFVTGATSGIGKEIALTFGRKHANVVINYRSDQEEALRIKKQIEQLGGNAITVQGDVSVLADCDRMIVEANEAFNGIDTLINNAGITKDNLLIRMKEEEFDQVVNVNLKGTWNMCKASAKMFMKQRTGSIINISSVVGVIGNPGQSNYVASKAGIIGLTKSIAKEFGVRGVRVNAIAPGFIETKMTSELPSEVKENYLKQIPLNTFGTSNDIANACLFLASEYSTYITSQVLGVNGGMI